MVPAEVDVAIVGFGPTGATLANACGRLGLRTLVYERSHAPYPLPRACHLDAEIARVFQDLGFEPELASLVTPSAGMEYVGPGATHLFSFEGFEREQLLGWPEDLVFIQPDIDRMLRRGVDRYPTVEVHLGAAAPPVMAIPARFVVACDGAGSDLRRELGIPPRDLGFDEQWLVVDVMLRRPVPLPRIIQQVCDPARLATFVPSHGPHRRWELRINEGEDPGDLARPERVWSLLAPWGVGPDEAELVRAVPYRFHAVVAERWRAGPSVPRRRRRPPDAAVHGPGPVLRRPRCREPGLEAGRRRAGRGRRSAPRHLRDGAPAPCRGCHRAVDPGRPPARPARGRLGRRPPAAPAGAVRARSDPVVTSPGPRPRRAVPHRPPGAPTLE